MVRQLLTKPTVLLYCAATTFSAFGDFALFFAAGVWAKELTGSSAQAGMTFFFMAAGSLLGPFVGAAIDRVRRKHFLIWANVFSALLLMPLLLVHDASQMWIIDAVMFAYGVSGAVITAAGNALVPLLVTKDLLADVNGLQQALSQGLRFLAPGAGVGLYAIGGGTAVALLDAATFLAAAVVLLAAKVDESRPEPVEWDSYAGATAGFRYLRDTVVLRQIAIACAIAIFAAGFMESLDLSVVTEGLHQDATYLGVLATAQGLTAIVGGLTAAPLARRVSEGRLVGIGLIAITLGVVLYSMPNVPLVLAGEMLLGLGIPWVMVGMNTAAQARTPTHIMGRVSSALGVAIAVPQAIGIAAGAGLTVLLHYRTECYLVMAIMAVAAVYILSRREQLQSEGGTTASGERTSPPTDGTATTAGRSPSGTRG